MIRVENVHKSFGEQHVLKGIDAEFEAGKANLIIGRSGSGKTVLIKCMVGLLKPEEGHIYYDGVDITTMTEKELKLKRRELGMLFQGNALFDSMTVEQNIRFPLDMFTSMNDAEKLDRVNFWLEKVNLPGVNKKYPSELSGGMMKRVGIARAVVMNPKFLYCDEPNSGLDPKTALVIDELIHDLTEEFNITTIINTHDMNSVMGIGDKVIFLHQGYKHWVGDRFDARKADNPELYDFIFASEFLKELKVAADNSNDNKKKKK